MTTSEITTPIPLNEKMLRENLRFYDALWSASRLITAQRFNTWPLVSSMLSPQQTRLEVAPRPATTPSH